MARVQRREEGGGGVDDVAARQAAEEAARRRAEEEARRRAEEAAAQRAADAARRVAEAAKQTSAMESSRRVGRKVTDSVRFEPAGRRMPVRQERSSMKFAVANARAEVVKGHAALEAAKAGVLTKGFKQAVESGDVVKMKSLALPKIEAAAMKAADLVDHVAGKASAAAQGVVLKESLAALGAVAKAHEVLLGHELTGRAGIGADGIRENLPPLAHKVAALAQWADEGLKMGDVHATAEGVRQGLWEVKDVVGSLHDANEGVASLSKWEGAEKVRSALGVIEGAAARIEGGVGAAEARLRYAEASAVDGVNDARRATGFDEIDPNAPPEAWMPAEGEVPSASNVERGGAAENAEGLTEEDVAKLGTGLPQTGGTQVIWNRNDGFPEQPPGLASAWASKAVEQGVLTKEQEQKANDLANKTLPTGEKKQFEVSDTAALAKQYGIDAAKMDPNQLSQATRMLNAATTVEEQRACVSVAVRNFQLIADNKTPQFSAEEKKNMMWAAAKIPGHAVDKLKPGELDAKFTEVTGATNAPGEHQFKLGKYNTSIKVSDDGKLEKSTCKKPSFLSKVGKIAKVALKVGSFIPGPIGVACRVANAVIGMVGAIKNGNWLGAIAAAAGGLAGGAAGFAGKMADKIGNIAKGIQAAANGIQAAKSKSLGGMLGAAAGVLGATAGAFGDKFKDMGAGLSKWAERAQKAATGAGAVEGVVKANAAVGAAKAALERARASGDPQAIADAMQGVEAAERGKKSALLGAGAAGLSLAAGTLRKDATGKPLPQGQRSSWQVGLEAGAGALNVARNVNDRNYAGALLDAAQMGQDLRQGTRAASTVNGNDGDKHRRFGVQEALDAAQGLNGWRDAEKAASQAKKGISAAESRLEAAQRSGDPAAVRQAQDELKKAKRSASDAELGVYSALQRANESVDAGLSSWKATKQHDTRVASQIEGTQARANGQLDAWGKVDASDKQTQVAAQASREGIAAANAKLAEALEKKDKAAISRAKDELDVALDKSQARLEVARSRPVPVMQLPVSNRNFNDLLASVPGAQQPGREPFVFDGSAETQSVTMQRGDSLEKIAREHGVTVAELREANPDLAKYADTRIPAGLSLQVPVRTNDPDGAAALQSYYAAHPRGEGGEGTAPDPSLPLLAPSPSARKTAPPEYFDLANQLGGDLPLGSVAVILRAGANQRGAGNDIGNGNASLDRARASVVQSDAYRQLSPEAREAFDDAWGNLKTYPGQETTLRAAEALVHGLGRGDFEGERLTQLRQMNAAAREDSLARSDQILALATNGRLPAGGSGGPDDVLGLGVHTAQDLRDRITSNNTFVGWPQFYAEHFGNTAAEYLGMGIDPGDIGVSGMRREASRTPGGPGAGYDGEVPIVGGDFPDQRQRALDSARVVHDAALRRGWGNCGDLAMTAAVELHDQGVGRVEIMGREGSGGDAGRHAFVVVGRDPRSNPNDPRTWGPNAVVVDAWGGSLGWSGRSYRAADLVRNPSLLPGAGGIEPRFRLPEPSTRP